MGIGCDVVLGRPSKVYIQTMDKTYSIFYKLWII